MYQTRNEASSSIRLATLIQVAVLLLSSYAEHESKESNIFSNIFQVEDEFK